MTAEETPLPSQKSKTYIVHTTRRDASAGLNLVADNSEDVCVAVVKLHAHVNIELPIIFCGHSCSVSVTSLFTQEA